MNGTVLDERVVSLNKRSNKSGLLARLKNKNDEHFKVRPTVYPSLDNVLDKKIHESGNNVKDLVQKHKTMQKNRLLQQHHATWTWEWSQLVSQENAMLSQIRKLLCKWQVDGSDLASLNDEDEFDRAEVNEFWNDTVLPVHHLREDLKIWINAYRKDEDVGQGSAEEVVHIIENVTSRQTAILQDLEFEYTRLEMDKVLKTIVDMNKEQQLKANDIQGIPKTFNFKLCPKELFHSLRDEFLILDIKYKQKLKDIDKHKSNSRLDGWNKHDHAIFCHIVDMHLPIPIHQQELLFDMLVWLFPHFTLDELLRHDRWTKQNHQNANAVKAVLADWKRSKDELINKANKLICKVFETTEENAAKVVAHCRQRLICDTLYKKVVEWRQRKMEEIQRKEDEETKKLDENKLKLEIEHEQRRNIMKIKLAHHKEIKKQLHDQQVIADKLKNTQMRLLRKEQAKHNAQRVSYRVLKRALKLEKINQLGQMKLDMEVNREENLERIRQSVSIEAPRDPYRAMKPTASFVAKCKQEYADEEEVPMTKPLFDVYGFTDDQISGDLRLKLENKFREAGVLHLPYAKEILKTVSPPKKPRPDMKSTLGLND